MTRVTWDAEAQAIYVYLSVESIDHTHEVCAEVAVDLDADGHAVGVEILNVESRPEVEALG